MRKWHFFLPFFLFYFFSFLTSCLAAENKSITVSASVPDEIAPTVPVLVSPENGVYLSNPTPTFIFRKSTDAQSPVRHYEMYLNGLKFIPEIPSSQTPVETNQFYSIISEDLISVSLKQPLNDGIYTWLIRAYDVYGNWSSSATWTFTIDTQAPFIIITQIGENINLNLSSQDPSSIPVSLTIETYGLQPEFRGRSEPGARVQISLTLETVPGLPQITIAGVTDSQGKFILVPEKKLEIGKYKVLIIASDAAGNTTVLPEFYLLVKKAPPSPLFPPPIIKKPKALLQLPQAKLEVTFLERTIFYLILLFLLLWLILSKIGYGFPWSFLTQYLKIYLVPGLRRHTLKNPKVNEIAEFILHPKKPFVAVLAQICLWLALFFSIVSLVFWPHLINLAIFIICLDLIINSLV